MNRRAILEARELHRSFGRTPALRGANLAVGTGETVMDLLVTTARAEGTTVVLVTHDARVAACAERTVMVRDGKVSALTEFEVAR
ncbi:MAG TPA: hypothetical protein VF892_26360 [Pseudonocardiaceae bacterium]